MWSILFICATRWYSGAVLRLGNLPEKGCFSHCLYSGSVLFVVFDEWQQFSRSPADDAAVSGSRNEFM